MVEEYYNKFNSSPKIDEVKRQFDNREEAIAYIKATHTDVVIGTGPFKNILYTKTETGLKKLGKLTISKGKK